MAEDPGNEGEGTSTVTEKCRRDKTHKGTYDQKNGERN